ncbi:MAG: hypothetical protein HY059_20805 [Proteobacteria bacterium]|nr:hypothetical protein [Pseudomonadota bacterium]
MRQELDESLRKRRVYWAEIDLNADRMPERIVIVEHPATCGTSGCMASIFAWRDGHWKFDSGISGEHKTFSILPETDLGWRRLHNGDIPYFRLPCGYFSQEVIDDDASVGSNPCRND